jgi:thymidylate synthase (FAD)
MEVELIAITPNAEKVIEGAGRTCYMSFEKVSEGSEKRFVRMVVKNGHHSVLEHATATFRIKGVSRACTHQLVRHRIAAYSQQSQRYVNEKDFHVVEPDAIAAKPEAHEVFVKTMETCREAYRVLKEMGIKNEDARFALPNAVETEIIMSANFREWRHIISLRGQKASQWEIRRLAIRILSILKEHAPTVFEDMVVDENNETVSQKSL